MIQFYFPEKIAPDTMKSSKIIFILCLWLLIAIFLGSGSAVADPRSKTGIEDQLSEIFSSPADQVDLTETLILISRHWDGSMVPSMIRGELGRLTESIRNQAKKSSSDREKPSTLKTYTSIPVRSTDRAFRSIPKNSFCTAFSKPGEVIA